MTTQPPITSGHEDLLDMLEALIDEEPSFDTRIRRELNRAHDLAMQQPPDQRASQYYDLCLDTVETIRKAKPTGLELPFMHGCVKTFYGVLELNLRKLREATDHFRESVDLFEAGASPHAEAIACVGLARTYRQRRQLTRAREYYERALLRLEKVQASNFPLVRFRGRIERDLDQLDQECVESSRAMPITGPPPRANRSTRIPVFQDLSAGLRMRLTPEYASSQLVLDKDLAEEGDFGVTVVGDSLIEAGIQERDLLILSPVPPNEEPLPGAIVAVRLEPCDDEPVGLLKHFTRLTVDGDGQGPYWRLTPENRDVPPIVVIPEGAPYGPRLQREYRDQGQAVELIEGSVHIVGRVVALIRRIA